MFLNLSIGKEYREFVVANLEDYDLSKATELATVMLELVERAAQAEEEGFGSAIFEVTPLTCAVCENKHFATTRCVPLFTLSFWGSPGRPNHEGQVTFDHVERIPAIKMIRNLTGWGITESKQFIERPGTHNLPILNTRGRSKQEILLFFKGCGYFVEEKKGF